jgi:hypothetical protein
MQRYATCAGWFRGPWSARTAICAVKPGSRSSGYSIRASSAPAVQSWLVSGHIPRAMSCEVRRNLCPPLFAHTHQADHTMFARNLHRPGVSRGHAIGSNHAAEAAAGAAYVSTHSHESARLTT